MTLLDIVLIGLSAALAVCVAWLLIERSWQSAARAEAVARAQELDEQRRRAEGRVGELERSVTELKVEAATLSEKADAAQRARTEDEAKLKQLREAFDAMASEALDKSAKRFLELAGQTFEKHRQTSIKDHEERKAAVEKLVGPIGETLRKTDEQLRKLENQRIESHAALDQRLRTDVDQRQKLIEETRKLSDALRKPEVRGRYGEVQLQRVAEVAGMAAYCDFDTQRTVRGSGGNTLRPDMVVRLPNDRVIIVDAKANIEPYLRALDAQSLDEQEALLERFADGIGRQARDLAKKEYWAQFEDSPEFVVMFVPGDQFVDAALARRPQLIEELGMQGVILASPSTLIGLLRAVHVGWREKAISESARELLTLGKELHERSAVILQHINKVGSGLTTAMTNYNKLVGSIDQRMLPTLRKFEDAGAKSAKALDEPDPIEVSTRRLAAAGELSAAAPAPSENGPARDQATS